MRVTDTDAPAAAATSRPRARRLEHRERRAPVWPPSLIGALMLARLHERSFDDLGAAHLDVFLLELSRSA